MIIYIRNLQKKSEICNSLSIIIILYFDKESGETLENLTKDIESYLKYLRNVYGEEIFFEKNELQESIDIIRAGTAAGDARKIKLLDDDSTTLFKEGPEWKKAETLTELNEYIHNCTNCPLGLSRSNFVFGEGSPDADIMIIGEAPGAEEDKQGRPFVGRAGQLLTKILEAIDLRREDVFIANILKCRPPENRRPEPEEIEQCEPYLMKQIELIQPEFILALGLTAVDNLLKKKHKMAETRGKLKDYHGIKMLVTYHPAALLRNPKLKRPVWEDVQYLRELYDEYLQNKKGKN